MHSQLAALAAAQHDIVTCAQALQAGYTHQQIRVLVRRGEWVRVRHGAYVEGERWRAANPVQQHLLVLRAALGAVGDESVGSHDSAAVAHGLPTFGLDLSTVMLTRPYRRTSRREAGVDHHLAELPAQQVAVVDDLAVTSPARTALDIARVRGFQAGLVCADAALHAAGASAAELAGVAALMAQWPGGSASTAVAAAADGRHESPGETLSGLLLTDMRLAATPQFPVPGTRYAVDFKLTGCCVIVEFDGRVKYATEDGQPDLGALWEEKKREDRIRELLGCEFVRVYWQDLFGARRLRTEQRIRTAVARAAALSRVGA